METIIKGRREGKTTELLKLCAANDGVMVCTGKCSCITLEEMAAKMGLNINTPITIDEMIEMGRSSEERKGLYIDDADVILQRLAWRTPIKAISITPSEPEPKDE